jgi:hypothetical protein
MTMKLQDAIMFTKYLQMTSPPLQSNVKKCWVLIDNGNDYARTKLYEGLGEYQMCWYRVYCPCPTVIGQSYTEGRKWMSAKLKVSREMRAVEVGIAMSKTDRVHLLRSCH